MRQLSAKFVWKSWVVALHLLVVLIILWHARALLASRTAEPATSFSRHYQTMLTFHLRGDAALPPGHIVFLGDSLVQGLATAAVSNLAVNYGIGTDHTRGILNRISQYQSLERAKSIVLSVGITDLQIDDDKDIIARYSRILQNLPATPKVYCSALLPIDESVRSDWNGRSNTRIVEFNHQLRRTCESNDGVFIPVPAALLNEDGTLPKQLHDGDGLHLNAKGNALWAAALRNVLVAE